MFRVTDKKRLAPRVVQMYVEAPEIAKRARPGQFVVLRLGEGGERIPLTIVHGDAAKGSLRLIFQEIGKTTSALGALEPGDGITDVVGPLGCPTEIAKFGTVAAVAGGVGAAELLPVAQALKDAGNRVIGIAGARTKELLILTNELEGACGRLLIATDDGTAGKKGFVTDLLNDLISGGERVDLVYAIGPVPMMKAVSNLTKSLGIKTMVSLNPIMVDGTGLCGACRVSVGKETKFACVDGPEFDGHRVDWEGLAGRLSLFKPEEKISFDKHVAECKCSFHNATSRRKA